MAVDTRNKRGSVFGFAGPARTVFPNPDASLANDADRQQISFSYAGISTATAVAATTHLYYALFESGANQYALFEEGANKYAVLE